jgi:GMP synthase (glutamine-hydrolysing)
VVEPLIELLKWQVRMVAKHLGLPQEFVERQPFPGPGISVRIVGEIRPDKLETVKKATTIAERELAPFKPSQYFAVIVDNEEASDQKDAARIKETAASWLMVPEGKAHVRFFKAKATGLKTGLRQYGRVVGISAETSKAVTVPKLILLQEKIAAEIPNITRVFYAVKDTRESKPYVIGTRAVKTEDFLSAHVAEVPWSALEMIAKKTLEQCPNVAAVYFDVTPKPPATVEME